MGFRNRGAGAQTAFAMASAVKGHRGAGAQGAEAQGSGHRAQGAGHRPPWRMASGGARGAQCAPKPSAVKGAGAQGNRCLF